MEGIRVIVCGGRDYWDSAKVEEVLGNFHKQRPIRHLHHGNAMGADQLAAVWGRVNGIEVHSHTAQWKRDGYAAGPIRNKVMLDQRPDVVIAFPGRNGTANMIKIARRAGVEVIDVAP